MVKVKKREINNSKQYRSYLSLLFSLCNKRSLDGGCKPLEAQCLLPVWGLLDFPPFWFACISLLLLSLYLSLIRLVGSIRRLIGLLASNV
jgi:hypothetical protein